jgi:hypothetical protein
METTNDAAYSQKPHDDHHRITQQLSILTLSTIHCDAIEELEADIQIENSRYTNRPEKSYENGLSLLLDLVDKPVHGEHNRKSPKIFS